MLGVLADLARPVSVEAPPFPVEDFGAELERALNTSAPGDAAQVFDPEARRFEPPRMLSLERSRVEADACEEAPRRARVAQGKGHRPASLIGVPTASDDRIREQRTRGHAEPTTAPAAAAPPHAGARATSGMGSRAASLQVEHSERAAPLPAGGGAAADSGADAEPSSEAAEAVEETAAAEAAAKGGGGASLERMVEEKSARVLELEELCARLQGLVGAAEEAARPPHRGPSDQSKVEQALADSSARHTGASGAGAGRGRWRARRQAGGCGGARAHR